MFLFFSIWCFSSNAGLFFCAAFVIYNFIKAFDIKKKVFRSFGNFLPYFLAPIPYLIYFTWYNFQDGAQEIRSFMMHYWSQSFMPLNTGIFEWMALQVNAIRLFIFSSYMLLGLILLLICSVGIFSILKKLNDQDNKIYILFLLVIAIHLGLSSFHLYPFSDRLLLYLSPFFILGLGEGLDTLCRKKFRLNSSLKLAIFLVCFLSLSISYASYLPKKGSNLTDLASYLKKNEYENLYLTLKSQIALKLYSDFVEDSTINSKLRYARLIEKKKLPRKNAIILSSQPSKFGHKQKRSKSEENISQMLKRNTIKEIKKIGNIVIYKAK